jgi:2-polyprenyl-3-methyl-5-hydroxy-6-metoxy-1,4-benzoquinol methylase
MASAKRYHAFLENLTVGYIPSGGKVLDMGAGIGTFAERVSAKGYNVRCVEPDETQRRQIEEKGLPASASAEELEDNSVDYIYSLNVLEHIENDVEALRLWTTKLKPGGKILVYVPAFNVLYSLYDKAVGHYRRYRKRTLVRCFVSAGLQVQTVKYADSVGFFVALIYKWINRSGKLNGGSLSFFDKFIFPVSRLCDFFCSSLFGKNVYAVGVLK